MQRKPRIPLPPELVRYTRAVGALGAVTLLAVTFPAIALVQIAASAGTTVAFVQVVMAGGLLLSLALMLGRLVRRAPLSRRGTVVSATAGCAVAFALLAAAPGRWTIGAAIAAAALLGRTAAPLRGVASQRFPAYVATAQQRVQNWSYTLFTGFQVLLSLVSWAAGWRLAAAVFAVIVAAHVVVPLRLPDFPDPKTERTVVDHRGWRDLFDLPPVPLALATLCLGVMLFQLLFAQLQPHLVDIGMSDAPAGFVVAALGGARLISLPFTNRYSKLADRRMPLATLLAARWIATSGACAAATLLPLGLWGVVPIVVAAAALEIGQNSQSAAVSGYFSTLSLEALTVVSIAVAGSAYAGGQLAPLLPWWGIAGAWFLVAVTVWGLSCAARVRSLRESDWRVNVTPRDRRIVLALRPRPDGVLELRLTGHARNRPCRLREGDRLVIDSPWDRERPGLPRKREATLRVLWSVHAKGPRRDSGRLRRRRRFPLVGTDGKVYGSVSWRGSAGTWTVVELGDEIGVELRSPTLARPLTLRHLRLHR